MEEIRTKDFLVYLKRYIIAFIVMVILAVTGAVVYDKAIKTPLYSAKTTIVIANSGNSSSASAALNDVNTSQKLTTTYGEIAKSELVLNQVIKDLKLEISAKELSKMVSAAPVSDTSIITVTVKYADPEMAAQIANKVATVFMKEVTKIYKLDNVSQLSVAEASDAPANNTTMRDAVMAGAVAMVIVGGFALVKFYLDDTVKHNDDLEKNLGLTVTGYISENDMKDKDDGELLIEKYPKSIVSENIKSLRTNLQFTAVDKNLKTVLVTSTNAGEGKSFVSANLAMSFAKADKKVLLIDCDLRRGRVHKLFGVPNLGGLSDLLVDSLANAYKYIRNTPVKNLQIITAGTYPPNPSELLASQKNKWLIDGARKQYDIIILDGAPVGGLADSVILSSSADETLLVVKDGATARTDLLEAKTSLEKVGAKIAGVVFNKVNHRSSKYYNYNYYYGEDGSRKRRRVRK